MRDLKAQMNRMEKRDREVEARDEVKRGPQGNAEAELDEMRNGQQVFRVREAKPVAIERSGWKCRACGSEPVVLDVGLDI
jgi:hypothetical protein